VISAYTAVFSMTRSQAQSPVVLARHQQQRIQISLVLNQVTPALFNLALAL